MFCKITMTLLNLKMIRDPLNSVKDRGQSIYDYPWIYTFCSVSPYSSLCQFFFYKDNGVRR